MPNANKRMGCWCLPLWVQKMRTFSLWRYHGFTGEYHSHSATDILMIRSIDSLQHKEHTSVILLNTFGGQLLDINTNYITEEAVFLHVYPR